MAGGPLRSFPSPMSPQIATARKLTVHLRPPASCDLEISLRGVKLSLSGGPEVGAGAPAGGTARGAAGVSDRLLCPSAQFQHCSHFFQMKNISFCGCHPRNSW